MPASHDGDGDDDDDGDDDSDNGDDYADDGDGLTKSHHGGNMSVMIKVGMCQCQNPTTTHDKVGSG